MMYYKNKLFFNAYIKESRLRWVLVTPQNAASIMHLVKEAFVHKWPRRTAKGSSLRSSSARSSPSTPARFRSAAS
jgi:hypothetical protein